MTRLYPKQKPKRISFATEGRIFDPTVGRGRLTPEFCLLFSISDSWVVSKNNANILKAKSK